MLPPDDRAESKKFDGGINMKKLLALLLAALMVFGMAACAKTAETPAADTPAGETTATADKPAEETTADETPAESDGDKIVIHYWAQWTENEAQAEVYKAAIARFEQAHPDCTVEVNWAGRDVREILRASIDSGNAIDIVDSGFDQIVNLLGEDYLMDLTSYMEGSDFEKAISAGMAAFAKSFASDGTSWYYIPSQPFVGTIYYNKAIFAEAGIDAMPTTWSEFMDVCQKIKDAGFYVIGRLTTFNDSFFVSDHPEYAISDAAGDPLYIAGSYWPSAFCRYVWEYKVALAIDAVQTMGFNEIQFDYVRFPDGTYYYEEDGNIDYCNEYDETKAQAIQRFLMFACDELHDVGVYVSADVFGETSGSYVTAYGQYWPAISNVVDVISGMPYPDHFAQNGTYRPWEHPYETLLDWAKNAVKRQTETPSPAIVRTWIQAYDAIRPPYNTYGAEEVGGQLRALQENGLDSGFMAWNAMCSIPKLETLKPAFDAMPD